MIKGNNIICLDCVYLADCYVKLEDGYSFIGEKLFRRVPDNMRIGLAYQNIDSGDIYHTVDKVNIGEIGLDNIRPLEEMIERDCVSKYLELDDLLKLYYRYVNSKKVRKRVI